jgi:O-acetyl-ADP-ribose deacetylase (regulator of RNase III)
MRLEVVLCDTNSALVQSWRRAFRGHDVSIEFGDLFDIDVDAYVSPANSYGYMDGGIDLALRQRFPSIQQHVQLATRGFLPVGSAVVVETGDSFVPFLVSAPTMVTPGDVSMTNNAYLATKAALAVARGHGAIHSIAFPGMATGIGSMSPDDAASQMVSAYAEVFF